ncbi:Nlrc3, partial [Symbiodinium necroappetens]
CFQCVSRPRAEAPIAEVPESPSSTSAQYDLTDPKSLAEYLNDANIRLVRAEYLYELLKSKSLLPRRQEAEEWGLVTHAEVRAWADGTRDAMICSVSHAWESREHPDPCAHQLKCLVDVVSLFDAAYFSDVWLFYDYVSLFQFKRESDAEEESFRRSMQDMHVLYAHECTRTFRIENLTPDDVWEAASKNSEYRVRVYDARSAVVRDRPLKELVANRVLYRTRGWCKAEVEWSSARSHSEHNHWIDAPESQTFEPELLGKVPMAPEIFEKDMDSAAFTHRSDAEEVKKLQFKVFLQKVSECEEALFELLPEGQLGQLAKALPYFKKLRALRLRDFKVGRAEAREFAQALASNQTIRELEIRGLSWFRVEHGYVGYGFLWEVIAEALKTNSTLTSINFARSRFGVESGKAMGEALKTNSTVTSINLEHNNIRDEGAQAIAEALRSNSTLTNINLAWNRIDVEGGKAICEALKSNSTLTSINLKGNDDISEQVLAEIEKRCPREEAPEAAKAWTGRVRIEELAERLNVHCNPNKLSFEHFRLDVETVQAISEALKSNSSLTHINFYNCYIGDEGAEAIGEALKTNSTLASINLEANDIGVEGGKAGWCQGLAKAEGSGGSKGPPAVATAVLPFPCEALAEALKSNTTVREIELGGNFISAQCELELVYGNNIPLWSEQAWAVRRARAAVSEALSFRGPRGGYRRKARRGPGERGTSEGALAGRFPSCTTCPTEVELC